MKNIKKIGLLLVFGGVVAIGYVASTGALTRKEYNTEKAIRLMDRPVAMKSNLHNVLFAPQTLEFWVANAGANTPAAKEPYTHYSLEKLLDLAE